MRGRGASVVEYLVVVGLLALGLIGAVAVFSASVRHTIDCQASRILSLKDSCDDGGGPVAYNADATQPKGAVTPTANAKGMVCNALGCKGNGNCFVSGTPVAVPDGHRAIESLHEGDLVVARDEQTGEVAARHVLATQHRAAPALVEVEIVSSHGRSTIQVTPEHPFFVQTRGWQGAAALDVGDPIVSTDGVASVLRLTSLPNGADVFNIEVEGFHTYFVGDADAWVHNDCKDGPVARTGMPIDEPRLRVLAPGQEGAGEKGGFALQRRNITGGDKIVGEPTKSVNDPQAASREARAAENFAARPDVKEVYLGAEADAYLRQLAEARGTPFEKGAQLPDVVGVKKDGSILIGEGKGVNVEHAGSQFESVGKHVGTDKIAEQWVFPSDKPTDRPAGKGGYLEEVVKKVEPGEPIPEAELKAIRKGGSPLTARELPDGGKEWSRLWKPNGKKVAVAIMEDLPSSTPKPAPVAEIAPAKPATVVEPTKPAVVEPAPAKVVTTTPAAAPPGKATVTEQLGITKPGGPSVGAQVKGQVGGVGLAVVATVAGKVVEHESGSPLAGGATAVTVAAGGTAVIAKVGGASVVKSVGGGLVAGAGGSIVREGVKWGGGSQTAGDVSGYATAGAIGAGFGGPIGAGGAVVAMAASDLAAAGVDIYYAGKEGERLEERRQDIAVRRAFAAVQNRDIAKEGVNLTFWKNLAKTPEGTARMYKLLAESGPARDVVNKIFTTHLGRPPTQAEMDAATKALEKGGWLSDVESNVILIKSAYGSILGRAPDANGMATWLGQLDGNMSREDFLRAIANSDEAKGVIANLYQSTLGRAPTPDELKTARGDLASGIGLRALQDKLAKQKTN